MHGSQLAQLAFVGFTLMQVGFFFGGMHWLEPQLGGMEGRPLFFSLKLIGIKELGLMLVYLAGVYLDDVRITYLTCCGRLTVLGYASAMTLFTQAEGSKELWLGVVQDVLGALVSLWCLYKERAGGGRQRRRIRRRVQSDLLVRLCVLFAGVADLSWAWQVDVYAFRFPVGMRSFAYMTSLVAAYQIAIALLFRSSQGGVDAIVYLAVAAHHLIYYFGATYWMEHAAVRTTSTSTAAEARFTVPEYHWQFGVAIVMAVLLSCTAMPPRPAIGRNLNLN